MLSDRAQEFPRFDERRAGRPHRYTYVPGVAPMKNTAVPLLRHDLQTGGMRQHDNGRIT